MALTRVQLRNFTAFAELDLELSPGINVLVGANGTGKTHLMKVCYAACEASKYAVISLDAPHIPIFGKLARIFLPTRLSLGRLARKPYRGTKADITISRRNPKIDLSFTIPEEDDPGAMSGEHPLMNLSSIPWGQDRIECVYIPTKEMLSSAPGFRSLLCTAGNTF